VSTDDQDLTAQRDALDRHPPGRATQR